MIAEDLCWTGPLAPGIPVQAARPGPALFAALSREPVAAASLAQVYKATTHDGRELAIKVQRPQLLRQLAIDMYVLRRGLELLRLAWGAAQDLQPIADEVRRRRRRGAGGAPATLSLPLFSHKPVPRR